MNDASCEPLNKHDVSDTRKTYSEGSVSFIYDAQRVFFNPTQRFNRDISVLVIDQYLAHVYAPVASDPAILVDCLSASGLRALRYSRELRAKVPIHIVANDISEAATRDIAANHQQNPPAASTITFEVSCADANKLLYDLRYSNRQASVIDIDPYGHPTPFLAAAMDVCAHNGLLCVTATDGAITCRKQCKECYIRYDAAPTSGKAWAHEGSIRIVLAAIVKEAARRRASIVPLVSFFHKHYLRVFVLVNKKNKCKAIEMYQNTGMVYHCMVCSYFVTQQGDEDKLSLPLAEGCRCPYCLSSMHISGPMWLGRLHDEDFLDKLATAVEDYDTLHTSKEIVAHISYAHGEVAFPPLLYDLNVIASYLKSISPATIHLASALEQLGYRVGPAHTCPGGLKTDAPFAAILGVLYMWHRICVLSGASKSIKNINLAKIVPIKLADTTVDKLVERYLNLDNDKKPSLLVAYEAELKSFYALHNGTEIKVVDYFYNSINAQKWFRRSWKDENGNVNYRAANFASNPEPNWGPKKAR